MEPVFLCVGTFGEPLRAGWRYFPPTPDPSARTSTHYVAKAKPDGYTFLVGSSGPIVISPSRYSGLPAAITTRINTEVQAILQSSDVKAHERFKRIVPLLDD